MTKNKKYQPTEKEKEISDFATNLINEFQHSVQYGELVKLIGSMTRQIDDSYVRFAFVTKISAIAQVSFMLNALHGLEENAKSENGSVFVAEIIQQAGDAARKETLHYFQSALFGKEGTTIKETLE